MADNVVHGVKPPGFATLFQAPRAEGLAFLRMSGHHLWLRATQKGPFVAKKRIATLFFATKRTLCTAALQPTCAAPNLNQLLSLPPALDALPLPALPAPADLEEPSLFLDTFSASSPRLLPGESAPSTSTAAASTAAAPPPSLPLLGSPVLQLGLPPRLARELSPAATPSIRASRLPPAELPFTSGLLAPSWSRASSCTLRAMHNCQRHISQAGRCSRSDARHAHASLPLFALVARCLCPPAHAVLACICGLLALLLQAPARRRCEAARRGEAAPSEREQGGGAAKGRHTASRA